MTAGSLLFVYGTLRRGGGGAAAQRLERSAAHCGRATFQGKLYRVEDYAAAIASEDPADTVLGDLYRLPADAALLAALDAYEGCGPGDPAPTPFRRVAVTVRSPLHGAVVAAAYLYNRDVAGLPRIAGGDFLAGP